MPYRSEVVVLFWLLMADFSVVTKCEYYSTMAPDVQPRSQSRIQQTQSALCRVALRLAESYGQRQFYALGPVQAASAAVGVDAEFAPWVFAGLVTRSDFEAFYSLRDAPGTYSQLRTELATPAVRAFAIEIESCDVEETLESVLGWLELAADFGDIY